MLFPETKNEERKKQILSSPVFSNALKELETLRQHYLNTPIETATFNQFKLFYTEGDRRNYQDMYFAKRGRLNVFTMASLLYERREDIEALEDIIWAICDEYTWVLPAHSKDLGNCYDKNIIDLFSAETGCALSEIHYLLGDKLDAKINKRIEECVEERIFQTYLNGHFFWDSCEGNWAAVCAGSVGMAFIYLAPDRFEMVRERIIDTLKCFLRSFGDDGACLEGISYWNYGFGYYTYFAQLLYEFTNGKENLFEFPICRKVALFQQNVFLRKNHTVSFADGSRESSIQPGLSQKLRDVYGDEILIPSMEYAEFDDHCHRFAAYTRNFFWTDSNASYSDNINKEMFYPDAGWYLCNNSALSFAAKAGHNEEPHNHNDIGSFILVSDDGQILCDFGAGEYDRDYFSVRRYNYLCNSSRGHSLPIINGKLQQEGEEFSGTVISAGDGRFVIDIAGAYDEPNVKALKREVSLKDNVFELCDSFEYNKKGNIVRERFVTMIKPEWDGERLKISGYELKFDGTNQPLLSSEKLLNHMGQEDIMYMIDFELTDPKEFRLRISEI